MSVLSGFKRGGGRDKLKKQVKIRKQVPPETAVFFEIIFLAPKWFPNLIIIRSFYYVQNFSKFSGSKLGKPKITLLVRFCRFVGRSNDFSCTPLGPISFLFMQFSTKKMLNNKLEPSPSWIGPSSCKKSWNHHWSLWCVIMVRLAYPTYRSISGKVKLNQGYVGSVLLICLCESCHLPTCMYLSVGKPSAALIKNSIHVHVA